MKRAIITGATGAIGTALIRELIKIILRSWFYVGKIQAELII